MGAEVVIDILAQDNASGVLGNIGSSFAHLGEIVSGIRDAFDLVKGAIEGVIGFATQFTDEASASQDAVANLNATLVSTKDASGMSADALISMADSLQSVTKFSHET